MQNYWTKRIGWRESVTTLCEWLNDVIPIVAFAVIIALALWGDK